MTKWFMGQPRLRLSPLAYQAIGDALWQGDPLADELASYGAEIGMDKLMSGLHLALSGARTCPAPVRRFVDHLTDLPDWVDWALVDEGGRFLDRWHPVPHLVLRDVSLMTGYRWADLNKPLVMTGALQHGAGRRVAQTMKWVADCARPGGLRPSGPGFASTAHVRLLHATVRRQLLADEAWDLEESGLPINQADLVVTWLAFCVVFLYGARAMGVVVSKHEALAVMHLWRVACWLMGVDEHWLTDDETTGRRLLLQFLSTYRGPDATSKLLGRALMADVPSGLPRPAKPGRRYRLRCQLAQLKHLSMTAAFSPPGQMRALGLPSGIPPVYPLLCAGPNLARSAAYRASSRLSERAQKRGLAERDALVRLHFRGQRPDLAAFVEEKP